jgi:2-dehydropantoate 2-reductase
MALERSYAIIGTGALGGYYGASLAAAGGDVHFLVRRDVEHLSRAGLRVESPRGDLLIRPMQVYRDAAQMPPCDRVIVALKTTENHQLDAILPGRVAAGGCVVVLQNGLGVEADCRAVLPDTPILGGCCFLCSNKVGPGHIRHLDYGRIELGAYQPPELPPAGIVPLLREVAAEFQQAGIETEAVPDLWLARWRKLMWNIPFNGLSVVLDASTAELIEQSDTRRLCEALMEEVRRGAAACDRRLPPETTQLMLERTERMVPYDSSMRLDYLSGRPMELEAIFAAPIRAAQAAGVELPNVAMLHQQLLFLQASKAKVGAGAV